IRRHRQADLREGDLENDEKRNQEKQDQPEQRDPRDQPPTGTIVELRHLLHGHSVNTTGLEPCHDSSTTSSRTMRCSASRVMLGSVTRTVLPESICTR